MAKKNVATALRKRILKDQPANTLIISEVIPHIKDAGGTLFAGLKSQNGYGYWFGFQDGSVLRFLDQGFLQDELTQFSLGSLSRQRAVADRFTAYDCDAFPIKQVG